MGNAAGAISEQYIEIGLEEERYALRIEQIQEIIKMQPVTEIHCNRPFIKGVVNLRGKIVPIISLRLRFGLAEGENTKQTSILIVNSSDDIVGIVVDRVYRVTTFEGIQPPPPQFGGIDSSFLAGVGQTEDRLVHILNLEAIFAKGGAYGE
ncbi:chemotaxis protein CheW [Paenibacillus sp. y28]|uniref:chemotaxis protein CheW n=1 Tax=Paenibacillus sp. y28 TaxID=3129110 RepID=UPI003019C263